jgi:hypothetical protein
MRPFLRGPRQITAQQGHREQALDRARSMTHPQNAHTHARVCFDDLTSVESWFSIPPWRDIENMHSTELGT